MYACSNCGGNLIYDIAAQKLKCQYCSELYDPYEVTKEHDGEERLEYDVSVFSCPQCGGSIYSTDQTAAGFCSFCGASTVLSSRIEKEKRPGFIIPFQISKDECKKSYKKMVRRAVFAPKELKNSKCLEEFRGIYMPYWLYYITQRGRVSISGSKSRRSGDYICTSHYDLNSDIDVYYKGVSYDASSSFADSISQTLGPYDVKKIMDFTPSYLSGFYADTADVDSSVYDEDAMNLATDVTKDFLEKKTIVGSYNIEDTDETLKNKLNTCIEQADRAMFPVWFMTYRNRDRVAYATVNGQNGKVVADLPVNLKKYFIVSLLLAVILFLLLNMFFTFTPSVLLQIVSCISSVVLLLYHQEQVQIDVKEGYTDDKGKEFNLKLKQQRRERASHEAAAALGMEDAEPYRVVLKNKKAAKKKNVNKTSADTVMIVIVSAIIISAMTMGTSEWIRICMIVFIFVGLAAGIKSIVRSHASGGGTKAVWGMISIVIALLIVFWNPVNDIYYYAAVILSIAAILVTIIDLIFRYNILATRKIPQFDYKGGDHRG